MLTYRTISGVGVGYDKVLYHLVMSPGVERRCNGYLDVFGLWDGLYDSWLLEGMIRGIIL